MLWVLKRTISFENTKHMFKLKDKKKNSNFTYFFWWYWCIPNHCHAEYFYVLYSSPAFILLNCSIVFSKGVENSVNPDQDLQCFQNINPGSAGQGLKRAVWNRYAYRNIENGGTHSFDSRDIQILMTSLSKIRFDKPCIKIIVWRFIQ